MRHCLTKVTRSQGGMLRTDVESGRSNQKRRTRAALVQAARDLLRAGGEPSLDEVAEAALVSRSTAYRYFPSREALLGEALLDEALGDALTTIHDAATSHGGEDDRLEATVRADHDVVTTHERAFRTALREWVAPARHDTRTAKRPGNRLAYLREAVAPLEGQLSGGDFDRLVNTLAMVVGIEAIVVLRDVCELTAAQALDVKCWAARAILRGATAGEGPTTTLSDPTERY